MNKIHVEVSNLQELEQALADKRRHILPRQLLLGQVREAMQLIRGRADGRGERWSQVTNGPRICTGGGGLHQRRCVDAIRRWHLTSQ